MTLPIDEVLPGLLAGLRESPWALLVAPPGAGKTTRVAPALLGEQWCSGQVLLLVPGRDAAARIEPQMASAIRAALGENEGSLLAFLPGVAEIERTADALGPLAPDIELHKLHGGIEPAAQRKALAAPPPGKRKLVLAT